MDDDNKDDSIKYPMIRPGELQNYKESVTKMLKAFESIDFEEEKKRITKSYAAMADTFGALSNGRQLSESITRSIDPVIKSISSSLVNAKAITEIIEMAYQLCSAHLTETTKSIKRVFTNAGFDQITKIINDSLSQRIIDASEFSFIKSSMSINAISSGLVLPKGFKTSLKELQVQTVAEIRTNAELKYDTEMNCFISGNHIIRTKGMNVICIGKRLLNFEMGDELFRENELIDFASVLNDTPGLAGSTEIGQRILAMVHELFDNKSKTIGFDKKEYYHCRSHKIGEMDYTFSEMLKAPMGLPWAGRYNHAGQSHYYFSDTKEGAEAEVRKHLDKNGEQKLQTMEIIPQKEIKLLDLSGGLKRADTFLKYIRFPVKALESKMPKEYLLPCFVGDCCKMVGFDGIKYYGTTAYNNYVCWNDGYFGFGKAV